MTDVLIVCGGTGGHLAPGIALAQEFNAQSCSTKLYISKKAIDAEIVKKYKELEFDSVSGKAFSNGILGRLQFILDLLFSIPKIILEIRIHKPKVIVLFGGFLSVGFGLIGFILNQRLVLHEANCRVGKAVRLLKHFASRIYLPDGVSLKKISKGVVKHCGYPLRKEFVKRNQGEARSDLGLKSDGRVLVVIGGSQGAEVLNQWVMDHFDHLADLGISIYCVTGLKSGLSSEDTISLSGNRSVFVKMVPFSDDMVSVLSSADLILSRAGAGSIAEITRCEVPSILIPYPYAADDHQLMNARMHEQAGAGIVVSQNRIDTLRGEVEDLIFNDRVLEQLKINLAGLNKIDSSKLIVQDIMSNFFPKQKH